MARSVLSGRSGSIMKGLPLGNLISHKMWMVLLLWISAVSPVHAKEISLRSKLQLSFLGLGVGKLHNAVAINGDRYNVSGSAKTSSVVSVISPVKAVFSSKGRFSGARSVPEQHVLNYQTGKKSVSREMKFSGGNLAYFTSVPEIVVKKGTIPTQPHHLKSIIDPVTALLFPVAEQHIGNGRKICDRVLPVWDGQTRINLRFSYHSSSHARVKGFSGEIYTCSVRYLPVSGHRPFKENIKFMQANRDMQITVARAGNSNVYVLFGFRVKTRSGTASGYATRFIAN